MLAPLSMSNAEYALWSLGVAYVKQLGEELDCDEFNRTRLMHSLTVKDAPTSNIPIDLPHLPWMVYAYGSDGFAMECPPIIQEHEELVWLVGNLKLEVA
ncbi:hypothetical protein SO802_002420 [Lithocarpus litseifolius]|uniref:Uncharacterized protein n=1 Tax=Lithocarpus litseifolius TaxID=425828 RepID=A0AAW2E2T6_9ROSI